MFINMKSVLNKSCRETWSMHFLPNTLFLVFKIIKEKLMNLLPLLCHVYISCYFLVFYTVKDGPTVSINFCYRFCIIFLVFLQLKFLQITLQNQNQFIYVLMAQHQPAAKIFPICLKLVLFAHALIILIFQAIQKNQHHMLEEHLFLLLCGI
jgi:hypothetical protein